MAKGVKFLLLFTLLYVCYSDELKSNSGDVSLSINIPSLALSDLLSGHKHTETRENIKGAANETAASSEEKDEKSAAAAKESKDATKSLDLAKLLSSGKPLSIKSTETSTMGEKGNTEKSVKEIAIDTLGDSEAKSNTKGSSDMPFDEKTISKLVPALKQALLKSDSNEKQNTTTNVADQGAPIEEMKKNPSSGLNDEKTAKALSTSKDLKSKNNEEEAKEGKETSAAKENEEHPAETPAAESKPAAPENSKKGNSMGNQIALVPVSLPSSVLSQLQSAINGGQGGAAGGNMSAASGNSTSGLLPALSSLLGGAANAALGNLNGNKTTAEKEMSSEHKNETSTATPAASFNNETSSMTNSSTSEMEEKEGSKLKNKKEKEGEKSDKYAEKSAAAQNEGVKDEAKAMKKDTPVLVVIPQITNAARDMTEKSGFFSKKATSNRIRSGLHKKSKVQKSSKKEKAHKKSKVHRHKHHH